MHSMEIRRKKRDSDNIIYFSDDEMMSAYSNINTIGADEEYEKQELKDIIRNIIKNELSNMQRMAIVYVFYEGYTYRQAAEKMGVTKSSVDKYISRALLKIRSRLKEMGVI